ncbi:surface-adhesin E family protein [Rhizobium leguminosarum]
MTKHTQQARQSLGPLERTKAHAVQKIALVCFLLFGPPAFAGQWESIGPIPGLEYLPDSAHRIGSHVYFVHRNAPREGGPNFVIANEIDCENQALRISWADGSLGNVKGRYYNEGKSHDHYATTNFKAAETDKVFFDWACKLPLQPERLVNVRRWPEDKLTQVDIGSVTREGAMATLWMRHDYPAINVDPPYSAPFDSKREFVQVNCKTNRYRVLMGYDFLPDGSVTDGMIAPGGEDFELTPSDSYAAAKEIACETAINPRSFVGIGGDTIRPKASSLPQPSLRD